MALDDTKQDLTYRERLAMRILVVMYRLVNPGEHSFKVDRDLQFILAGKEKD